MNNPSVLSIAKPNIPTSHPQSQSQSQLKTGGTAAAKQETSPPNSQLPLQSQQVQPQLQAQPPSKDPATTTQTIQPQETIKNEDKNVRDPTNNCNHPNNVNNVDNQTALAQISSQSSSLENPIPKQPEVKRWTLKDFDIGKLLGEGYICEFCEE